MTPTITVEPTTDESYIKSVFLNPFIYAAMKDDSCPDNPQDLSATGIMAIPGFFLRVVVDGMGAGVFWLLWKGESVEAHTALLPNCRGRDAINATNLAIRWVFENTSAREIRSYAWSNAPAVRWFCRAVGMREDKTLPWRSTRSGVPVNITWYNVKREEII